MNCCKLYKKIKFLETIVVERLHKQTITRSKNVITQSKAIRKYFKCFQLFDFINCENLRHRLFLFKYEYFPQNSIIVDNPWVYEVVP